MGSTIGAHLSVRVSEYVLLGLSTTSTSDTFHQCSTFIGVSQCSHHELSLQNLTLFFVLVLGVLLCIIVFLMFHCGFEKQRDNHQQHDMYE